MPRFGAVSLAVVTWLVCVVTASFVAGTAQEREGDGLRDRFHVRAESAAALVSAYLSDVFARERRLLDSLPPGPLDGARLGRLAQAHGFESALMLDGAGNLVAASPRAVAGVTALDRTPHLSSALAGRRAVSDVGTLPAEGGATVAFALPVDRGRGGALEVRLSLTDGPLPTMLAWQAVPGTRGYIVDSRGRPVVDDGRANPQPPTTAEVRAAVGETITVTEDRALAAAPVQGTGWHLTFDAPEENLLAPVSSDDTFIWGLVGGLSVLGLGGIAVGAWVGHWRARQQRERQAAERRFELTVQHAPEGMTLFDGEHRFLEPNKALCAMLGRTADQLRELTLEQVIHPDDVALDQRAVEQLVAGEIPSHHRELRFLTPDQDVRWGRLTVSVLSSVAHEGVHLVAHVQDVTAMRAAQLELEHRALYDPLTGLANRTLLVDRLTHALAGDRGDRVVAVAFCDVDHFKRINDSLGHEVGDRVLTEIAVRLREIVRAGDTVGRFGGDEFVIVLTDVRTLEEAREVLARARQAVAAPVMVDRQVLTVNLSVGLAMAGADDTADTVLRNADTALYVAKDNGRSRCEVYDAVMSSRALTQLMLEQDLRKAIAGDEFELHYQPIADLESGRTVAYEGLIRWRHPHQGLLPPSAFLPVAEESDLILELGRIAIEQACRFAATHAGADWRVFINVSPHQLGRGLDGLVAAALREARLPAKRLGVEIIETGVLKATGSSLAEMKLLRAMGVDILIDDFGTGYSALSSVLTTPITGLKLDRSFTAELGQGGAAGRITSTVADLVQSLSLHGVVEGIETEEQRRLAHEHGWKFGQGFLFGRPQPPEAIEATVSVAT